MIAPNHGTILQKIFPHLTAKGLELEAVVELLEQDEVTRTLEPVRSVEQLIRLGIFKVEGNILSSNILPLSRLKTKSHAVLCHVQSTSHKRRNYLASLGLVPGVHLILTQKYPAMVIEIGETELAIDPELGQELLVKPHEEGK